MLIRWITVVLQAPLDEIGVSLSQLSARNKRVEVEFYLPISELLIANQLDALIRQFDPLSAGCPPLEFMQVRGILKGFIDRVFCHKGCCHLLDYKPNWLGGDSSTYAQQAIVVTMQAHRYDLQYQLYTLTLYRYLRHRVADCDYEHHFDGVIYLFLRGVGREHPQQGIYTTRPNAGLIVLIDEMFADMILEET